MSPPSKPWRSPSLTAEVRMSPPVDTTEPYDPSGVWGKTIVITGGASGFGEGFFRRWASHGAHCIIGDINDSRGRALVKEVRKSSGNNNHHYLHCDVTDWQSQVDFFRQAAKLSPHGGIDSVVANAGIGDNPTFESPKDMDTNPTPPKPNLMCIEVNLTGVLYTTHLAYFYLPRNPGSEPACPPAPSPANVYPRTRKERTRDRHLLLIGSCASFMPLPTSVQYNTSKHAVLGMFRCLRSTSFTKGIRINLLMPYYIDTPLLDAPARAGIAGCGLGKPEDVVDAGTRFMADASIAGRGLVIGPRVRVEIGDDGEAIVLPSKDAGKGEEMAIWEAYADDWEEMEVVGKRLVRLLNQVEYIKGWLGFWVDFVKAVLYPFRRR